MCTAPLSLGGQPEDPLSISAGDSDTSRTSLLVRPRGAWQGPAEGMSWTLRTQPCPSSRPTGPELQGWCCVQGHRKNRPLGALGPLPAQGAPLSTLSRAEGGIQFQDKDQGLPGLKLVQQPSDQRVAQRGQDVTLEVRLGARPAPQGDELGCAGHLVSLVLHPLHEAEHAPGRRRAMLGAHARLPGVGAGGVP